MRREEKAISFSFLVWKVFETHVERKRVLVERLGEQEYISFNA